MPIHDWTRVDAGIFHAFHFNWIFKLAHVLNGGLLPEDYYALPEQVTRPYVPDILTLKGPRESDDFDRNGISSGGGTGGVLIAPILKPIAETDLDFYRRKQKVITVRHTSDDDVVAIIEIVSKGNKAAHKPMQDFIAKAADLLDRGIHLLIVDLYPRGPRDPNGIHGAIWLEVAGQEYTAPPGKPFTLAAYETGVGVRAYVVHVGLNDVLLDMPLFLEMQKTVTVPLESTYNDAFAEVPHRWRRVLESGESET